MQRRGLKFILYFIFFLLSHPAIADTIVVANTTSNNVTLLNENTLKTIKEISVGYNPHEVVITQDGKFALVSNFGDLINAIAGSTISVIDIAEGSVVKTIELPKRSRPHGMAFLSNTEVLITAQGIQSLLLVNLETNKITKSLSLPGAGAHMVVVDRTQQYAYITNTDSGTICKVDLRSWSVVAETNIGLQSEGITLTSDEDFLLSTNSKDNLVAVLRTKNLEIVKMLPTQFGPVRVTIADQGKSAVVLNSISGTAQVIDLSTLSIVKTFPSTISPAPLYAPANIIIRPDQTTAYISNFLANNVALVDLTNGVVLKTFKTAYQPNGLALSPIDSKLE